ncbi:hypothetical protein Taro_030042 [Colocasia esculenta]|uniref:Uncharacterized protein n=1 Tax=Colocasia esculenta TaxID=4460 RepID=A0A843VUZ9_COLES|nr:hypothetical protein [Colocasia esculenta]
MKMSFGWQWHEGELRLVTLVVLTPSASRPTNDSIGLVLSSGDVNCVDAISFKTYERLRWPGDASCVDTISFKTYERLCWPGFILGDTGCVDVISFKTYEQLRWPSFISR